MTGKGPIKRGSMGAVKALFFHEMRTKRWFLLLGVVCVVLFGIVLEIVLVGMGSAYSFIDAYHFSENSVGSSFSSGLTGVLWVAHIALGVIFIVLVPLQFRDYHKRKDSEFISSLAVTQRQWFFVKLLTGYGVLTLCCLLVTIVVLAIRASNIESVYRLAMLSPAYEEYLANETIWHTLRSLFLFWIIIIALYSIYAMAHSMVNTTVMAGIVGCVMVYVPSWIFIFLSMLESFAWISVDVMDISYFPYRLANVFWGETVCTKGGGLGISNLIAYDSIFLIAVSMLCVIGLCLCISSHCAKKADLARGAIVIESKKVRTIFSAVASVEIGTTISMFYIGSFYSMDEEVTFIAVSVITTIVLFFVFMKLLKLKLK